MALATSLVMLIAGDSSRAQQWLPPIQKVPHLFIQTEVLGVRGGKTRSLGKGTIEASPGRPGTLTVPLDLGPSSADHPTSIQIEVTQNQAGDPKIGLTVVTTVEVNSRAGEITRVRRERIAEVDEGRSFFHQAYENAAQGTSVLLTMTPDTRIVPQLVKPSFSAPIVFNVSMSHVTAAGDVPLEDNVLRTLENSPVTYAFRIATVGAAPVETIGETDATGKAAPPEPATEVAPPAFTAQAPSDGTMSAQDDKGAKARKTKPKKMSRKEREREALAQYERSREAQKPEATGAPAEGAPPTGSATAPEPASSASTSAGASASASADGGSPPSGPPAPDGSTPGHEGEAAGRVPAADELELTLLPHRVESGILMVEASLRGRAPGAGGTERATLIQRTQAITSNGSFDITVSGLGPTGAASYRFSIQARF